MQQETPNIKVAADVPAERDSCGGEVYEGKTKFCKFCGKKIAFDAVVCTHCGRQVELLQQAAPAPTNRPAPSEAVSDGFMTIPEGIEEELPFI